jgi:hypothetical protein
MKKQRRTEMSENIVSLAKTAFHDLEPVFGVLDVSGKKELAQTEIDTLAQETWEAKEALKTLTSAVKERVEDVRRTVFTVADEHVGEGNNFALYSPETGLKLTREIRETGGGIDTDVLLKSLFEHFGEEYGDKTGNAWAMFKRVTDVPEVPRVLNQSKLESELSKSMTVLNGMNKSASSIFPVEVVRAAEVPATKVAALYARKMTKDEMAAWKDGTLETGAVE